MLLYLGEEAMRALGAIRPESTRRMFFDLQPAAIAARIRAADGSRPRWWAGTPRGQRRGGGPLSHQRVAGVRAQRFRFLDNQAYSGQDCFCSSVLVFGDATLGRSKGVITQAPLGTLRELGPQWKTKARTMIVRAFPRLEDTATRNRAIAS